MKNEKDSTVELDVSKFINIPISKDYITWYKTKEILPIESEIVLLFSDCIDESYRFITETGYLEDRKWYLSGFNHKGDSPRTVRVSLDLFDYWTHLAGLLPI